MCSYTPRTLKYDVQTRGRLPAGECVEIGLSLATALAHLHRNGLVHRDVKPSNIIFIGGAPKLADIGLVTDADTTFSYVGTEGYVSPEGPGAPQADIYALGKVLYEISTGKDRKEYPLLPPELRSVPESGLMVELNAVILKACARDPRERYASAEALRADLELLQRGRSVRQHRARQQFWSVAGRVAAAAAGLASLGVLALWASAGLGRRTQSIPGTAAGAPSIFVLPFRHEASASEPIEETEQNLWLCGRITDAFIDGLALVPGLSSGPRKSDWLRFDEDEVRHAIVRTNESRLYHEPLKQSRPVNAIERQRALQHLAFGESVWRNHDEAIRLARRSIELAPDQFGNLNREIPQAFRKLVRCHGAPPLAVDILDLPFQIRKA
jgi:hypothetical protein